MEHDEVVMVVNDSPVRAYRGGDGPPLVLLHGGGLDSARLSWEPVWAEVTRRARVLAPDLPGYGGTPLGATPPTLEGYRDWLRALLDQAGWSSATIGGLSLGGGVALRTALDTPTYVEGLLLCAPYGVSPALPGGRAGYFAVHAPGATALTNAILRRSDPLVRRTLGTLTRRPGAVTDELVDQVRAVLADPAAGKAWSAFQRDEVRWSGPRTVFDTDLSRITTPAVLLSGERDTLVPPADVRAAAARIPAGRFEAVPDAGHWLVRDAPDRVVAALARLVPDRRDER